MDKKDFHNKKEILTIKRDSHKKKIFLQMITNKNKCVQIIVDSQVNRGTRQQHSELRLSGQFQACYFFLRKDFERTKNVNQPKKQENKNKQAKNSKGDGAFCEPKNF